MYAIPDIHVPRTPVDPETPATPLERHHDLAIGDAPPAVAYPRHAIRESVQPIADPDRSLAEGLPAALRDEPIGSVGGIDDRAVADRQAITQPGGQFEQAGLV